MKTKTSTEKSKDTIAKKDKLIRKQRREIRQWGHDYSSLLGTSIDERKEVNRLQGLNEVLKEEARSSDALYKEAKRILAEVTTERDTAKDESVQRLSLLHAEEERVRTLRDQLDTAHVRYTKLKLLATALCAVYDPTGAASQSLNWGISKADEIQSIAAFKAAQAAQAAATR